MNKIGIITESIHGLPEELIREYDIRVAPMGVTIRGKGYWDFEQENNNQISSAGNAYDFARG